MEAHDVLKQVTSRLIARGWDADKVTAAARRIETPLVKLQREICELDEDYFHAKGEESDRIYKKREELKLQARKLQRELLAK